MNICLLDFPTVNSEKPKGIGLSHPFFLACDTLENAPAQHIICARQCSSLNLALDLINYNKSKNIKILDLRQDKQVIINGK